MKSQNYYIKVKITSASYEKKSQNHEKSQK